MVTAAVIAAIAATAAKTPATGPSSARLRIHHASRKTARTTGSVRPGKSHDSGAVEVGSGQKDSAGGGWSSEARSALSSSISSIERRNP